MKLFLKGSYELVTEGFFSPNDDVICFKVPMENAFPVDVKIFTKDQIIEAYQEIDVDQKFLELLESASISNDDDISIFTEKTKPLSSAVNKTVYALRFFLNWGGLDKQLINSKVDGMFWSKDNESWGWYPHIIRQYTYGDINTVLSKHNSSYIQSYLDGQLWEPFVSVQFLDKAKSESNAVFKWINATIAAELAIKEFFIRYDSKFERYILEAPSPPLHKLYGSILESMVGERSPVLKAIQKGVEIRNRLVHRPSVEEIDLGTAEEYVENIEFAIFHLLSLLYSKNDLAIKERIGSKLN